MVWWLIYHGKSLDLKFEMVNFWPLSSAQPRIGPSVLHSKWSLLKDCFKLISPKILLQNDLFKWISQKKLLENDLQVTITWEVTVTSNDSTICSSLQVTSLLKIFEKFFCFIFAFWAISHHSKWKKNFWKFWEVTVTWSDVTSQWHYHLLVTSKKWRPDGRSH